MARLILKCVVGDQSSGFLCDEQIHIIKSADAERAYTRALELGRAAEHEYLNSEGTSVKWLFMGLFDLDVIEKLEDGAEITSKRFVAQPSDELVVSKEQLSVFFIETIKDKTARDILDESQLA